MLIANTTICVVITAKDITRKTLTPDDVGKSRPDLDG